MKLNIGPVVENTSKEPGAWTVTISLEDEGQKFVGSSSHDDPLRASKGALGRALREAETYYSRQLTSRFRMGFDL